MRLSKKLDAPTLTDRQVVLTKRLARLQDIKAILSEMSSDSEDNEVTHTPLIKELQEIINEYHKEVNF